MRHALGILRNRTRHHALCNEFFTRCAGVDAKDGNRRAIARSEVISKGLERADGAFRHRVAITDDKLDHSVILGVVVEQIGCHVIACGFC